MDRDWIAKDLGELESIAVELSSLLKPGIWIRLEGEMGAGKTTLVRALLKSLGWKDRVGSPTYPLMIDYEIRGLKIIHLDAYRLQSDSNLAEPWNPADWKEEVLLVEWAKNSKLPRERFDYQIDLKVQEDESRKLSLKKL